MTIKLFVYENSLLTGTLFKDFLYLYRCSWLNDLCEDLPGPQGDSEGRGEVSGHCQHLGHGLRHQGGREDGRGLASVVEVGQVSYRRLRGDNPHSSEIKQS